MKIFLPIISVIFVLPGLWFDLLFFPEGNLQLFTWIMFYLPALYYIGYIVDKIDKSNETLKK